MEAELVIRALGALAQEHRLAAYRLLVQEGPQGMPAGALAEAVGVPGSSMSFHLGQLAHAGLVTQRRQSRSIIYSADFSAMNALMGYLTENCCGGVSCSSAADSVTERPFSVLVLCTGNSARSILGEAILRQLGAGRIIAHSAGSRPKGMPHPGALRLLARKGIDIAPFRSKSWDEFTAPEAPPIDLAITVCGNAAGESCPVFMGAPMKAHWGLPDPADVDGDDAMVDRAFDQTWRWLELRVRALLDLPFETMDRQTLAAELARIGLMEGAA